MGRSLFFLGSSVDRSSLLDVVLALRFRCRPFRLVLTIPPSFPQFSFASCALPGILLKLMSCCVHRFPGFPLNLFSPRAHNFPDVSSIYFRLVRTHHVPGFFPQFLYRNFQPQEGDESSGCGYHLWGDGIGTSPAQGQRKRVGASAQAPFRGCLRGSGGLFFPHHLAT